MYYIRRMRAPRPSDHGTRQWTVLLSTFSEHANFFTARSTGLGQRVVSFFHESEISGLLFSFTERENLKNAKVARPRLCLKSFGKIKHGLMIAKRDPISPNDPMSPQKKFQSRVSCVQIVPLPRIYPQNAKLQTLVPKQLKTFICVFKTRFLCNPSTQHPQNWYSSYLGAIEDNWKKNLVSCY